MRASELESTGKRFLIKEKGQFLDVFYYTIVDSVTGVNYVLTQDIYNQVSSECFSPLFDATGKLIVSSDDQIQTLIDEGAHFAD